MSKLPYSRTILVNLTRNDKFPARSGFGTVLFLQSTIKAGQVDATHLTKAYSSMDEVAADWTAGEPFYEAANKAFSQNPRPTRIKAGFYPAASVTAAAIQTNLDAIWDADNDWYFLTIQPVLRDGAVGLPIDGIIAWTEAHRVLASLDTNAVLVETPGDVATVAGRKKGQFERTSMFYHTDAAEYGAVALAATLGTYNFDEVDMAYTAKYKKLEAVAPINVTSAKLTSITGFVEGIGQSIAAGHMVNTQVDIGGQFFVVEGSTLTPNVFMDEIHSSDWIVARTEETMLGILLNNKRVRMDDAGMEVLASGVRTVMAQARRAGLIANDFNPTTGEYESAVEIIVPSVFDIPAAQRKARIAPAIVCNFRYAGAVHYTTVEYTMNF